MSIGNNRGSKMIKENVVLYKEPVKILEKLSDNNTAEMSAWQLSFLCGLIKENHPEKIVEIGVAAGGTTSVIMNCVSTLDMNTEIYSLDLNAKLYYDKSKNTGYLATECNRLLPEKVKHYLYTGGISVEFLEKIGDGIDFLILDTAHVMPGELLDFLACLPYLKRNAIVVLHDIVSYHTGNDSEGFATQLLLDVVSADKIVGIDDQCMFKYPNIGAFRITEDTIKHIEDVFSALMLTWSYCPTEKQLNLYRDFYERHYSDEYVRIFDLAIEMNKYTLSKKKYNRLDEFAEMYNLLEKFRNKKVYIYGCGDFGKKLKEILEKCNMLFIGYIISDGHEKPIMQEKVYNLSEVQFKNDDTILVGVDLLLQEEIRGVLQAQKIKEYVMPNKKVCGFLRNL